MQALNEKSLLKTSFYKLQIETINKFAGGDITKNQDIMKYLPKSPITDQLLKAAKKGTPVVRFGNKNKPGILLLSGVHGNEYPPQIAAIKLINRLAINDLNITIYVIPFAIPYSTEKSLRSWKGQDPNRNADIFGSPTNNILNFSKANNIRYLGDFHSTRPGSYPGRLSVICSEIPCILSYQMANFIENETKSSLLTFTKAGSMFHGALEDVFNIAGIPAITGEVMSPHGKIIPGSIEASIEQMEAFLKYHKAIKTKTEIT
jgi:predicted deacylase